MKNKIYHSVGTVPIEKSFNEAKSIPLSAHMHYHSRSVWVQIRQLKKSRSYIGFKSSNIPSDEYGIYGIYTE